MICKSKLVYRIVQYFVEDRPPADIIPLSRAMPMYNDWTLQLQHMVKMEISNAPIGSN